MRKKVIALIAAVALIVTMIPITAFAAEETKSVNCNGGAGCTHEVEMDGLHYGTLGEAVGIANDDRKGNQINLLKSVILERPLEIQSGENNINLKNLTISSSARFNGDDSLIILKQGSMGESVIENGEIIGTGNCATTISGGGVDFRLKNVTVSNETGPALALNNSLLMEGNTTIISKSNDRAAVVIEDGRLSFDGDVEITSRDGAGYAVSLGDGGLNLSGTVNINGLVTSNGFGGSITISEEADVTIQNGGPLSPIGIELDNGTITNEGTLNADIHIFDTVKLINESSGVINGLITGYTENVQNKPGGVINHEHSFGEWIVLIKPTDTMIGLHYRECYCGEREYAFIPATGTATVPGGSGGNTGGSAGGGSGSSIGGSPGADSGNGSAGKLEAVSGADNAVRVSGGTRFETATNVADQLKGIYGVEKFDNIVVTYSDVFADAMSASALAADKEAPILVVNKNNEGYVKNYITKNLARNGNVYIVGGTGVVSERFEDSLENCKVKRISGKDRYETNLEVLKELNLNGSQEIMIASGSGFADALSASATGNAIMLVGDKLTAEQEKFIESLNKKDEYFVVGGTGAVNNAVYNQVKTAGSGDVMRISGSTRYDTSAAIAEEFFGKAKSVFVASGDDFPDGLTGGVLANATGAPLLLANENNTSQAENFVVGNKARMVTAIGGSRALSDKAIGKIA